MMSRFTFLTLLLALAGTSFCSSRTPIVADEPQIPKEWSDAWSHPAPADRPLQIVHGMNIHPTANGESQEAVIGSYLQRLQDYGL